MRRFLIFFLPLVLRFAGNSLYAQSPNPPPGWQYVMNLDSIQVLMFHASGDTIFFFGNDNHVAVQNSLDLVSYDGGKNWDTMFFPSTLHGFNEKDLVFSPTEAKMVFTDTLEGRRRFYTTRDAKHYDWVEVGADSTKGFKILQQYFIDPHNPDHWIWLGYDAEAVYRSANLVQSFDAGRTWTWFSDPNIPSAEKTWIDLRFDSRREGVWYLNIYQEQNHVDPNPMTWIVKTTDNGASWKFIKQWGTDYGIGGPNEVRKWWAIRYPSYTVYGPEIGDENDDSLKKSNWLEQFHPQLPLTGEVKGYYRSLTQYTDDNNFISFPSNYKLFTKDPYHAIVVEGEEVSDSISSKMVSSKSWIYQTTDDWKTWETIWESGPFEWVDETYLDENTPALWVKSTYLRDTTNGNFSYTSYLYKKILNSSFVWNDKIPKTFLTAFPNPTTGMISIFFPSTIHKINSIIVCDIEGREVLTAKDFLFSQGILEYSVPKELPSGLYFLKMRTESAIYFVKIILQR